MPLRRGPALGWDARARPARSPSRAQSAWLRSWAARRRARRWCGSLCPSLHRGRAPAPASRSPSTSGTAASSLPRRSLCPGGRATLTSTRSARAPTTKRSHGRDAGILLGECGERALRDASEARRREAYASLVVPELVVGRVAARLDARRARERHSTPVVVAAYAHVASEHPAVIVLLDLRRRGRGPARRR